jgi:hypothetical protein
MGIVVQLIDEIENMRNKAEALKSSLTMLLNCEGLRKWDEPQNLG